MLPLFIFGLIEGVLLYRASRIADPLGELAGLLWHLAGAFAVCVHAYRFSRREPARADQRDAPGWALSAGASYRPFVLVFAMGALFRAFFIATPPALSTDVYRYVWDARAQMANVNPYLFAPNAPQVSDLFDAGAARINHPEISTIYPPLSQLAFRVAQSVVPGPSGMKILFALLDLAVPLVALVALRPPPAARLGLVILTTWHPLAVIETAGSGHNDPLAILFLLGALAFARYRNPLVSGLLLGAAAASKTLPILLLPLFLLHLRGRDALVLAGSFVAVLLLSYLPFADAGGTLIRGLSAYSLDLEFNAGLYALFGFLLHAAGVPRESYVTLLRLLPLLAIPAAPLLLRAARADLSRAVYWTLGGLLLVSSQVHPWYLLWILPFLGRWNSRAWLAFTFFVIISYRTHALFAATGAWIEPLSVRLLQYVPLFALLALEGTLAWRARRHGKIAPQS